MDENTAKKRFLIFMLLRLGGLILFFVGVAIAFSGLVRAGGLPALGIPIALLGLAETVLAPKILKRFSDV